jgi:hypothetical protein
VPLRRVHVPGLKPARVTVRFRPSIGVIGAGGDERFALKTPARGKDPPERIQRGDTLGPFGGGIGPEELGAQERSVPCQGLPFSKRIVDPLGAFHGPERAGRGVGIGHLRLLFQLPPQRVVLECDHGSLGVPLPLEFAEHRVPVLPSAHAGIGHLGFSSERIVLKGGHQPGSFSFDFFLGKSLEKPSRGIVEMLNHAPRIIGDTRGQARGILFDCGSLQLGVGRW